eukprot:TRINITY_DN102840_c0_g1_i1.p1 TRINITY_DN102840_c0_g1~~TRINITY_DN102840_c0_g1_i1.p1  ORF type:complete len:103 (-),score=16.59 TRINITY_DN102840_c0_g1_i1:60-368(-)
MGFPIDHGAVDSPIDFMSKTARIIREEFMARAPENPNFSVMALVDENGQVDMDVSQMGSGDVVIDEAKVQSLVSMGFPAESAREALVAAGGDENVAVGILCG